MAYFPLETNASAVSIGLTDGCSTGSTGVASAVQTTQSRSGTLSNAQLQDGGKKKGLNVLKDQSEDFGAV